MNNYMVFDIGGSSIKWSVINDKGEFFKSDKIYIPKTKEEFFDSMASKVNDLKEEYKLKGIGISAPGAVGLRNRNNRWNCCLFIKIYSWT